MSFSRKAKTPGTLGLTKCSPSGRHYLDESGGWTTNRHLQNAQTSAWHEQTKADFRDTEFPTWADFTQFRFPGHALFRSSSFPKGGNFASSEFLKDANFLDSEFGDLQIHRTSKEFLANRIGLNYTDFLVAIRDLVNMELLRLTPRRGSIAGSFQLLIPERTQHPQGPRTA